MFSDRPGAVALRRVPASLRWSRDARAYASRQDFDAELADAVAACTPDWVVCAGYLRILGDAFVQRFRGRLLNIHPSLLPKFPACARMHAPWTRASTNTVRACISSALNSTQAP